MLTTLGVIMLLHLSAGTITSSVLFQEVTAYHNKTNSKAVYAYNVVNKIYNAFRQWFFTITFCEFTYFENRILKYTESKSYGYPVILLDGCPGGNRTRVKPKINKHGQTAYVITGNVLNLEISEYVVDALIRTGVFKPRSAVIFILNEPVEIDSYFLYTMKTHFQFLWSKSITNSVVILKWVESLKIYTYNAFNNKIIDITDVEDIIRILYHQYDNLLGHVLRLSVYKKISSYDEIEPIHCKSRLTVTIMRQLNATCKPLAPRDGKTIGDMLTNGTANGVISDLIDGYTDLELSSRILKNSYYGYIDTTYPLMRDELCFMLKGEDKQSSFTTTLKLISFTMFMIFMFNVIFMISVTLLTWKLETNILNSKQNNYMTYGHVIMDLVKCFIKQTVTVRTGGPVYQFMVLIIIVYSLIVNCIIDVSINSIKLTVFYQFVYNIIWSVFFLYQGIITSAITYPRYISKINTFEQLVNSNLTLGLYSRHMDLFNMSISASDREKLENRIEILNNKKIIEVIEQRNFQYALLLRKTDALFISRKIKNMENGRPIFQVMADCPIPCYIVYGLRNGSPYLRKIENILHHLYQGGIANYWLETEDYKVAQTLYYFETKSLRSLSLSNLRSVYMVWAMGITLSSLAFLIEFLVYYCYNKSEICQPD